MCYSEKIVLIRLGEKLATKFITLFFVILFSANHVMAAENLPEAIDDKNSSVSYKIADWIVSTNGNVGLIPRNIENKAHSYIDAALTNRFREFLQSDKGVTEASITGITKKNPQISALILRPITESSDGRSLSFIQSSLIYFDSRTTANIGLGKRFISKDEKIIYGVNAFYDHEFPHNHRRVSIGGEIKTSLGELSANRYFSMSDWKLLKSGNEERALSGHDLEFGIPLPYMPTTYLRVRNFEWYAYGGTANPKGTVYSVSSKLNNHISIEFGRTKNRHSPDQNFLQLSYNFNANSNKKTAPFISDTAYELKPINDKIYDKVRRENRIVKQVRAVGFSVEFTGV